MFRKFALVLSLAITACHAQSPQTQTAPPIATNAQWVNGVAPGYAPAINTGLSLKLGSGTANCGGTIIEYAGGNLTMTASSTNRVYLDTSSSCAPAVKTTAFTLSDIPIATVVAGSSTISSIDDVRTMQTTGGGMTQLHGDGAAGPGTGNQTFTLTNTTTAASCGDATHVCVVTYDAKGRILSTSAVSITAAGGLNQLTGDVAAGPGTGSQAATLANVLLSPGACGDATHVCQVTYDAKGRAIAAASVAITATAGLNQLHGDGAAGPGTGDQDFTLTNVLSTPGSCGNATHVCVVTYNAKGLAVSASSVLITQNSTTLDQLYQSGQGVQYALPYLCQISPFLLCDSDISDNSGLSLLMNVPVIYQNGNYQELAAPGPATHSANQIGGYVGSDYNFWDGTVSQPDQIQAGQLDLCTFAVCGTTPQLYYNINGGSKIPQFGLEVSQDSSFASNSNHNIAPPPSIKLAGFYNDGTSTGKPESCTLTPTYSGTSSTTNPNITLTLNCAGSSGTLNLVVNGSITANGGAAGIIVNSSNGATINSSATLPSSCTVSGSLYLVSGVTSVPPSIAVCDGSVYQYFGNYQMLGIPTLIADSGAGTGSTRTLGTGSDDGDGTITLVAGTSTAGSNTGVITVVFGKTTWTNSPVAVQLTPGNALTAALPVAQQVYANPADFTPLHWILRSGSTALTAGATYVWNYHVARTGN